MVAGCCVDRRRKKQSRGRNKAKNCGFQSHRLEFYWLPSGIIHTGVLSFHFYFSFHVLFRVSAWLIQGSNTSERTGQSFLGFRAFVELCGLPVFKASSSLDRIMTSGGYLRPQLLSPGVLYLSPRGLPGAWAPQDSVLMTSGVRACEWGSREGWAPRCTVLLCSHARLIVPRTPLTKHKFKGKNTKDFTMVTARHESKWGPL